MIAGPQGGAGAENGAGPKKPFTSEQLQIETTLHAVIIGTAGATINRIRTESGARVDLQYAPWPGFGIWASAISSS